MRHPNLRWTYYTTDGEKQEVVASATVDSWARQLDALLAGEAEPPKPRERDDTPHGPTLQEAAQAVKTMGDHYGAGWLAGRERAALVGEAVAPQDWKLIGPSEDGVRAHAMWRHLPCGFTTQGVVDTPPTRCTDCASEAAGPQEPTVIADMQGAIDWVLSLETPPRPNPSGWTDIAWCNYWREQRSAVLTVMLRVASCSPVPPERKESQ